MKNVIKQFKKLSKLEQNVLGAMVALTIVTAIGTATMWYHLILIGK